MRIFYVTKSLHPYNDGGGPLMRAETVKLLTELGYDVRVVLVADNTIKSVDDNHILIKDIGFKKVRLKLERFGIIEDYLTHWSNKAFNSLRNIVKESDLIFVTTGSELGTIKLGSRLKTEIGCKLIINFRDPLAYTKVNNDVSIDSYFFDRGNKLSKYLNLADKILTSSKNYQDHLVRKYGVASDKISTNYFGSMPIESEIRGEQSDNYNKKLVISYAGKFGNYQSPECLLKSIDMSKHKDKVQVRLYGDVSSYPKIYDHVKSLDVVFVGNLKRNDFIKDFSKHSDIGFVSLNRRYFAACVPSKIYEYANLDKPILGLLPRGDAYDIVNENFGWCYDINELRKLSDKVDELIENKYLLNDVKLNIRKCKDMWSMELKIKDVHNIIKEM